MEINIGPRQSIGEYGVFGFSQKEVSCYFHNIILLSASPLPWGWIGEKSYKISCENVSVSFLVPFRKPDLCGYGGCISKQMNLYTSCVIIPFVVDNCALFFYQTGNVNEKSKVHKNDCCFFGMYGVYASLRDQRTSAFDSSWIRHYKNDNEQIHYCFEEMYMAIGYFPARHETEYGCSLLGVPSSPITTSPFRLSTFITNCGRIGSLPIDGPKKVVSISNIITCKWFQFESHLSNDKIWNQKDQTTRALPPRLHSLYRDSHFISEEFPTTYLSYFQQPSFYNSCFTPGTWIQMHDGTRRLVEDLRSR